MSQQIEIVDKTVPPESPLPISQESEVKINTLPEIPTIEEDIRVETSVDEDQFSSSTDGGTRTNEASSFQGRLKANRATLGKLSSIDDDESTEGYVSKFIHVIFPGENSVDDDEERQSNKSKRKQSLAVKARRFLGLRGKTKLSTEPSIPKDMSGKWKAL